VLQRSAATKGGAPANLDRFFDLEFAGLVAEVAVRSNP
jgi:hypothetical protein